MNGDLQNTQTGMTVEEVRGSLDLTDNGAIRNSIRNCLTVFQNDPYLQGAIRYNIRSSFNSSFIWQTINTAAACPCIATL